MFDKNKIHFIANNEKRFLLDDKPSPAYTVVPEWFKETKRYSNGTNNYSQAATIFISNNSSNSIEPKIQWRTEDSVADMQPSSVLGKYPTPYGHNPTVFRWHIDWHIKTSNNSSILVTHPFHRYDLPFTTLSAIIDSDKHPNSLVIPFFIRENFHGFIEAGTPIAQILPFSRESWESDYSIKEKENYGIEQIKKFYERGYKKLFWSKKNYK